MISDVVVLILNLASHVRPFCQLKLILVKRNSEKIGGVLAGDLGLDMLNL